MINFPNDKTLQGLLSNTAALTWLCSPSIVPSHSWFTEVRPLAVAMVNGVSMVFNYVWSFWVKLPLLIKSKPLPLSMIHLIFFCCHTIISKLAGNWIYFSINKSINKSINVNLVLLNYCKENCNFQRFIADLMVIFKPK